MSNLGGLILLVYFLYRGFVLAAARLARRADSDTSELSKHRQRDTDRAARQEQSLAAEHECLSRVTTPSLEILCSSGSKKYITKVEKALQSVVTTP
jgi:hypothetical protein